MDAASAKGIGEFPAGVQEPEPRMAKIFGVLHRVHRDSSKFKVQSSRFKVIKTNRWSVK
jgi:hypothetical protein